VAIFSFSSNDLVETPNTPRELWRRNLNTQVGEGTVRVVNSHDGYAITVPSSWQVPDVASGTSGLSIFYHPLGLAAEGVDLPEGLFLKVWVEPAPQDADIRTWAQQNARAQNVMPTTIGAYSAFSFSRPLQETTMELETSPIEDSLLKMFLVQDEERLFVISCSAEGAEYLAWIALCEEHVSSFEIL